jgi:hypothetical protein
MSTSSVTVRSQVLALVGGLVLFALCSLLRQAVQSHLTHTPYVAALLTFAVFLLPGAFVGAVSPRYALLDGVVLAVLAAAFATLQIGGFSHVDWTARPTWQVFGAFASLGFILCEIGALGGRALARSWSSSKSGTERAGKA